MTVKSTQEAGVSSSTGLPSVSVTRPITRLSSFRHPGWRLGLPVLAVVALAFALHWVSQASREGESAIPVSNALPIITNSIGMQFARMPEGAFQMGGADGLAPAIQAQAMPVRNVTVRAFWLATTEVTQAQWQAVMGENDSQFKDPRRPVDQVTFLEVQEFIRRLNRAEKTTAYRLPSEAEWEYAARAGKTALPFLSERDLNDMAWYGHQGNVGSRPVGGRQANAWGLFDMLGNVWEWTEDCWHQNYDGAPADARAWIKDGDCGRRVLRGGGWNTEPSFLGITARGSYAVDLDDVTNGFRLAKSLTAGEQETAAGKAASAVR